MTPAFLYISIDGILSHLGFGQVVRVVEGLAARGLRYHIVSLERASDLADTARVERLRDRLARARVGWTHGRYEAGSPRHVVANQMKLAALCLQAVSTRGITHVHARGYHAALVAVGLGRPWVFDARGYWIDERIEEARWFTTPARLALARATERMLYRRATRVVTLTQLHADDLESGAFGARAAQVTVIPTCADYDDFRPLDAAELAERAGKPRVVGIIGSVNRAYRLPETGALAAAVADRDPSAVFHLVSADHAQWRSALEAAGVPPMRIRAERAPHEAMPQILREMSWVVMLLTPETRAKRAMMPTKLAECFASGARVCVHGCNREVGRWVDSVGGGVVLNDLSPSEIARAAEVVAGPLGPVAPAREASAAHFSLESGLRRYHDLLTDMAG